MYICFPLARDLEAEYLSQKCASYRPVVRCLETPLYVDDLRFEVFSMAAPHRAAFSSAMARSPRLCISSPVHRSDVFEGDQLLSLHATSFRCVLRGQLKRQLERWGMGFGVTWVLRPPPPEGEPAPTTGRRGGRGKHRGLDGPPRSRGSLYFFQELRERGGRRLLLPRMPHCRVDARRWLHPFQELDV